MESFGVDKIYLEKLSGKGTKRPRFQEMIDFLREGDTLYVESFSRLSRSTRDLLDTVNKLNEKGDLRLKDAVEESGVSQSTFFRKCKQLGIKKEIAV